MFASNVRVRPAFDDHAVVDEQSRVGVGPQRPAAERIVGSVHHLGAVQRHVISSARADRSRSKVSSRSAATLTAIVAGSLPVISASPMGVRIRAIDDLSWPLGGQHPLEPGPFPRRADQSDRAEDAAAEDGVAQRRVLGVVVGHDQRVGARRELAQDDLREQRDAVDVDVRHRVRQRRQPLVGQLLGAAVDQVQLDVVPGEDARQLEPDVANAEDRHGGHDGQRLEQHRDRSSATLNAVLVRRLVRQRRLEQGGFPVGVGEQLPGPVDRHRLDIAAADRPPCLPGADHELGPGVARGVPANRCDRHQHARLAPRSEGGRPR